MKRSFSICIALLFSMTLPSSAQEGSPSVKMSVESVNAALVSARAATKDKHYSDSEALMLKATAAHPEMILPWIELGLAQIGLKKYSDAEYSFNAALGIGPSSPKPAGDSGFYGSADAHGVAPTAMRDSRSNLNGGTISNAEKRSPEILGVAYSSLGEIYIRTGRIAEAQAAFDAAVKAFPIQTASYRFNETILFFQIGNEDAQLAAAEKAIASDPGRAMLYYFKGQALVSKATIDSKTQKMILPPGCAEAYQRYLELDPNGKFANDAKGVLAAVGVPIKGNGKK